MKNKKDLIIELLVSDGDWVSTSRVANFIKSNQHDTNDFLEELLKEKKVERLLTPSTATYWRYKYKRFPKKQTKELIKKEVVKKW